MRETKHQRRQNRQQRYEQQQTRRKEQREIQHFVEMLQCGQSSDPGPALSPLALPSSRYRKPPRWPDGDMMQSVQARFERDAAQEG